MILKFINIRSVCAGLLFIASAVYSNNDSSIKNLKIKLSKAEKLEKINIYREIAGLYLTENIDSTLKYARKAWQLSRKRNDDTSEYASLLLISFCFENKAKYDSAHYYAGIALQIARKTGDSLKTANVLNNIGRFYLSRNDPFTARKYFKKSIKAVKNTRNYKQIASPYLNIGATYSAVKDYRTTIEYYMKGLKMLEKTDYKLGIALTWFNIGNIYNEWGKTDKAVEAYLLADSLLKAGDAVADRINLLNSIAVAFKNRGELEKGIQHLKKALELSRESKSEKYLFSLYYNLANFYHLREEYIIALDYLTIAKDLAEKADNAYFLFVSIKLKAEIAASQGKYARALRWMDSLETMINPQIPLNAVQDYYREYSDLFKMTGDYTGSMEYFEKYVEIKDSLFSRENNEKLLNFQVKYEAEKQEQQIKLKNIRIKMQKQWLYITLGGIFLLLCFLLIVLRLFYQKQRANKELVQKNLELAKSENVLSFANTDDPPHVEPAKHAGPQPSSEHKQFVIDGIKKMMESGKRYLEEDITLSKLAIELGTNSTYLSMIINEHFKKTFVDLINSYRVKEARKLFSTGKEKYSIDGIAKMSGFNSRSSFNRAFKKHAGITPSFYLRSLQDKKTGE